MPDRIAGLLERSIEAGVLWHLDLTPVVQATCHFLEMGEIEFTFDPREVVSREALDAVCAFMEVVGRALDRPVSLGIEGFVGCRPPDHMRYEPTRGQVVVVPRD